jgi:methylated-DNA-[protein]-cysteine S-methyltransferase
MTARSTTTFAKRVLSLLRRIPPGRVVTYGELARAAGRPGAARAVGNIMRTAAEPGLPYHRVIAAGGRVGGYGRDPQLKAALLRAEGHVIRRTRVVGFAEKRWRGKT